MSHNGRRATTKRDAAKWVSLALVLLLGIGVPSIGIAKESVAVVEANAAYEADVDAGIGAEAQPADLQSAEDAAATEATHEPGLVTEPEVEFTTQEGIFIERAVFQELVAELGRLTGLLEEEMEKRILSIIAREVNPDGESVVVENAPSAAGAPVPTPEQGVETEQTEGTEVHDAVTLPAFEDETGEVRGAPEEEMAEDGKNGGLAGDLNALRERLDAALEAGEMTKARYDRAMAVLEALDAEREALATYLESFWSKMETMPESLESRLDTLLEEKKITEYQHDKLRQMIERGAALMEKISELTLRPLTGEDRVLVNPS